MDCRRLLRLAPALFFLGGGCTPQGPQTLPLTPPPPADVVKHEQDLPPRQPKPFTCVKAADFYAAEAASGKRTPAERDQFNDQARRAYQQAIDLDPNYLPGYVGLARLYTTLGNAEQAIATYEKALQVAPREAMLHFELGACYARRKSWDNALTHLQAAAELQPDNPRYANFLGLSLATVGRHEEALAAFRRGGSEAKAHYNLARILLHQKQTDLCRQELRRALQADAQMDEARKLLAQLDAPAGAAPQPAPALGFDPNMD